MISRNC